MNDILKIFYDNVIPGLLDGNIDCEIPARIICNVYFSENNHFLAATNKYSGVMIPTLVINNQNAFNSILIEYVETMLNFYEEKNYPHIDKQFYIPYIIATAFGNMGIKDYQTPEHFLQERIIAIKENPIPLTRKQETIQYSQDYHANISYEISKDAIYEETPFKYQLFLDNGEDTYEFQTIRFYVINDTAYIGAIQGNKPHPKNIFEKQINRINFKANEAIDETNELINTNPGALIALTSFIAVLNNYGINKFTLLPYGIQRWNDKKILYHTLENNIIIPNEEIKLKVVKVIERTNNYFDKLPSIRDKFKNCLLRFNYHFNNSTQTTQQEETATLYTEDITNGNNNLLNNIYGQFYNLENKKTNH